MLERRKENKEKRLENKPLEIININIIKLRQKKEFHRVFCAGFVFAKKKVKIKQNTEAKSHLLTQRFLFGYLCIHAGKCYSVAANMLQSFYQKEKNKNTTNKKEIIEVL